MNRVIALSAAAFLGVGLGLAIAKTKPADLTLQTLDRTAAHLRDYRGKIVVLNFWATWCGPCQQEFPLLVETAKEMRARGVVFIAVSLDEPKTRSGIPAFLQRFGVEFPVWTGASADDLDRLKMGEAVPATAFVDADGTVVARVSGEIRKDELQERLEWLLGGRNGSAPKSFITHLNH